MLWNLQEFYTLIGFPNDTYSLYDAHIIISNTLHDGHITIISNSAFSHKIFKQLNAFSQQTRQILFCYNNKGFVWLALWGYVEERH